MTSEERREARYKRRKARREERRKRACEGCDDFQRVFSYENLYDAYRKCRKGVAWKASTQKYITQAPLNVYQTWKQLQAGKFRSTGFREFDIRERGKLRHIRSVDIRERVVQRCLCDNALVPAIGRTFIYDNGASMHGKGYSFAVRRLCQHLRAHYRKYRQEGYVLLFDFSKFFDRVSHALCKKILREQFTDRRIIGLTDHFVDAFGDVGLGLGSQISQILALASANRLDHCIKEQMHIRGYGRYMDDGYLIHPSKAYLQQCLEQIKAVCCELGITLNEKKTQIVKLSHGFTYLKVRVFLTPNGKVIRRLCHGNIVRMRRKLKAFRRMQEEGKLQMEDIWAAWQSWRAYAENFSSWRTVQSMGRLYNRLFVFRPMPA